MTAIEKYTHDLLVKQGFLKGSKDKAALERAKRAIDSIVIPSQIRKGYKAAEEYIGIIQKED